MTFKVLLLGDSGVGKTSLRTQYLHKTFSLSYRATIGANFITKEVPVRPGGPHDQQHGSKETISLCLWDTAGQERFNALGPSFYRGADAALIVYDCSMLHSINKLQQHLTSFLKSSGTANPIVVLVGNKCDLGCLISAQMALTAIGVFDDDASCQIRPEVPVWEVSARTGYGVDAMFQDVAERCRGRDARRDLLPFDSKSFSSQRPRSFIRIKDRKAGRCAC